MKGSWRHGLSAWHAVVVTVLLGCGSTEPTLVPTTIAVNQVSLSFAALGATVQLSAAVLDQNGAPVPNAPVTWSSSNPLIASVTSTGLVTAEGNGSTTVVAAFGGLTGPVPVMVAQVVAQLVKVAGDGQTDTVAQQLPLELRVRLHDALGTPMAGTSVAFGVTQGGGSLSAVFATTDAAGEASTQWTLGTAEGPGQVVATAGTVPQAFFSSTALPAAPANLNKVEGDLQSAAENTAVGTRPRVRVSDAFGNRRPGLTVTFTVIAGGGGVSAGAVVTNAAGDADVRWTLGPAGPQTLDVAVNGTALTVSFSATAVTAGAPANVALFVGDLQTGLAGSATNVRPAVRVTDAGNFAVANAEVTFTVLSGGGSLTNETVTTNADGVGQVGSWVLGGVAGPNSLRATVTGSGIAGNPVDFTATGASPLFDIVVRNIGAPFTPDAQAAFDAAEARWERIIFGDLTDIPVNTTNACGTGQTINETIDDLLILALVVPIDGPGGILGSAGACGIRSSNALTVFGAMRFDSADVDRLATQGYLADVILHEMGHVLGFAINLWNITTTGGFTRACAENPSSAGPPVVSNDTHFSCAQARSAFDSLGGASYTGGARVPLENCAGISGCGAGTINSHWRELVFVHELMTGYINSGIANPLSILTIASFGDMGYAVAFGGAGTYTRVFAAPPGERTGVLALGDDELRVPIEVLDSGGRVVRVLPPRR